MAYPYNAPKTLDYLFIDESELAAQNPGFAASLKKQAESGEVVEVGRHAPLVLYKYVHR
jgi:hypothetical protein